MQDKHISQSTLRVRYAETDAMGIVHHTAYIIWFEVGRSDWMRQRGSSYADFEASGYLLPVSEVGARYLVPARYDELVIVRTWVAELKSRKLRFNYEIVRERDGTLLVTGFSTHIVTDRSGRVTTFPPDVRQILAQEAR
ncbi:MAG: acyl-CoA thioesterase [Chloroflexi bacterium]|nr:acyl-CoA thioesterase [Chloroflexota bacterium]